MEQTKINENKCDCGKEAKHFHSKCCNAHFEGVITDEGEFFIACEKCGKYCATINTILNPDDY